MKDIGHVKVGLVGHCVPDSYALRSAVGRTLPAAEFVMLNDDRSLRVHASGIHLCLVNRALDGDFAEPDGIALIARLAASREGSTPVLMLISNYPEAQAQAVAAGAVAGFGKKELNTARAAECLRAAVV